MPDITIIMRLNPVTTLTSRKPCTMQCANNANTKVRVYPSFCFSIRHVAAETTSRSSGSRRCASTAIARLAGRVPLGALHTIDAGARHRGRRVIVVIARWLQNLHG